MESKICQVFKPKIFLHHLWYRAGMSKQLYTYEERLLYFNVISLAQRRKHIDCVFLHKLVHSAIDSGPLLQHVKFSIPRDNSRPHFYRPFYVPGCRTNIGLFAPINRLSRTINELPSSVDFFGSSTSSFKKALFTPNL